MNLHKASVLFGIALIFFVMFSHTYVQPTQLRITDSVSLPLAHSPVIKAAEAETAKSSWDIKGN